MSKRGQRRGKAIAEARRDQRDAQPKNQDASIDDVVDMTAPSRRTTDPNYLLYHYTTANGFVGIVETKTLWATQAKYLNDSAECQLLSQLLNPRIKAAFEEIIPKLTKVHAFHPSIADAIAGDALTTEAGKVAGAILKAIDRASPIHLTSFCMHRNGSPECEHGLLSQWRGYGRGGFAIQFDENELDDIVEIESQKHSYQGLITNKVAYLDHEKAAKLDRFDGIANASLKVAFEHAAPNLAKRAEVSQLLGDRRFESYISAFADAVAILKSPRFMEENEYRIVALPTRSKQLVEQAGDKRPWKEKHFREGMAGALVPYIKLFEGVDRPLPIRSVIVGPHSDQDNQVFAAKLLLEKNQIDVPVLSSQTTLRF